MAKKSNSLKSRKPDFYQVIVEHDDDYDDGQSSPHIFITPLFIRKKQKDSYECFSINDQTESIPVYINDRAQSYQSIFSDIEKAKKVALKCAGEYLKDFERLVMTNQTHVANLRKAIRVIERM